MPEVCVAQLFKTTAVFCSSTVHDSTVHNAAGLPMQFDTENVSGKRKAHQGLEDFVQSAKKLKSDFQSLQISRECSSLVGRLQLCNKRRHSWGGISAACDCLAFTDSTASVCCSISRGLDVSLVGKLVRVNSWSFIPISQLSSCQSTVKRGTKTSLPVDMAVKDSSNFHAAKYQDPEEKNSMKEAWETKTDIRDGQSDAVDESGFLEIHSLELLGQQDMKTVTFPSVCVDPAAADIRNALFESPLLTMEVKRPRLTVCGKLESISPQFSLPCNYTDDRDGTKTSSEAAASRKGHTEISSQLSMIGFLVELSYCHSCSCHDIDSWTVGVTEESRRARQLFQDGQLSAGANPKHGLYKNHEVGLDQRESFHVYFSGSLAAWRPTLSGNIKHCLTISGLRRKLVLTGVGKGYQFLLVATRTSLILPVVEAHPRNIRERCIPGRMDSGRERDGRDSGVHHDHCTRNSKLPSEKLLANNTRLISYAGFVTSILFQGTLLELDKHVWLLLTHQGRSQLHGLRVGAMLALRDVHAVTIYNPSEKALLLGACIRSHVSVLLFSPLYSPPSNLLNSTSLLLRYIQKLSFASAFWILSLIGSFRQKFRGIYSDKELMGSKKDPGIILKYVQKLLAPDHTLERPDYFKEFFDHQHTSCLGGRVSSVTFNKVPAISNFCEDIDRCSRSKVWLSHTGGSRGFQWLLDKRSLLSSLEVSLASWQFAQLIISSQELGVTLLGSLKVCQESGQLQLVDATGFVNVVIPDLFSSTHISKTYQVSTFTLMVKELTEDSVISGDGRRRDSSISWSRLMKDSKAVLALSQVSEILVHFYLRDATLVNTLSFCRGMGESFSQGSKRRRLDEKQTKIPENTINVDLGTLSTWLEQRVSEVGSASSPTSHLNLLCDSFSRLNPPNELLRVSCKVVAVNLLVFEYRGLTPCKSRPSSKSTSWPDPGRGDGWLFSLGIPLTLASVIVDDGCGLAHCWAQGDAAVTLLGLKSSVESELSPNLLARLSERYARSDMQLRMIECVCCLVRRHGKVVLRSERPYGASVETSYSLQWCGNELPDLDEAACMQAVVARACHNYPLVVTLGNIPPTLKDAYESSKSLVDCCLPTAYRAGFQCSRPKDNGWPLIFATRVDSGVLLSDVRAVSDEIAILLRNEP